MLSVCFLDSRASPTQLFKDWRPGDIERVIKNVIDTFTIFIFFKKFIYLFAIVHGDVTLKLHVKK